jgi:hypothetical protein
VEAGAAVVGRREVRALLSIPIEALEAATGGTLWQPRQPPNPPPYNPQGPDPRVPEGWPGGKLGGKLGGTSW